MIHVRHYDPTTLAYFKRRHKLLASDEVRTVQLSGKNAYVDSPTNPRDVVMTATTDALDLDGEVIIPTGCDRSYFERNRAIFADHEYDVRSVVGRLRSIVPIGERGYKVRAVLFGGDDHPLADTCLSLARLGVLGSSIGFKVLDAGRPVGEEKSLYPNAESIIRRWLWLELSLTALPCNPDTSAGVQIVSSSAPKRIIVV